MYFRAIPGASAGVWGGFHSGPPLPRWPAAGGGYSGSPSVLLVFLAFRGAGPVMTFWVRSQRRLCSPSSVELPQSFLVSLLLAELGFYE